MGTRQKRERQESLWYGSELPTAPGHPFYSRLNAVLEKADFDCFCEKSCALSHETGPSVAGSGTVLPDAAPPVFFQRTHTL
jgi:hypothetical protein